MLAIGSLSGRIGAETQVHYQQLGYNRGRSGIDLQVPMEDINDIQKAETKFSVAFFLFGHGEWDKDADLEYAYSPLVAPTD